MAVMAIGQAGLGQIGSRFGGVPAYDLLKAAKDSLPSALRDTTGRPSFPWEAASAVYYDAEDSTSWTVFGTATHVVASDYTDAIYVGEKSMKLTFQAGGTVNSGMTYKAVTEVTMTDKFITAILYIPTDQQASIGSVQLRIGEDATTTYRYGLFYDRNGIEATNDAVPTGWIITTVKWEDMYVTNGQDDTVDTICWRPIFESGVSGGEWLAVDAIIIHDSPTRTQYFSRLDDLLNTQYKAACYLAEKGMPGFFAAIGSQLNVSGGLSTAQLDAMRQMGHVLVNHTSGTTKFGTGSLTTEAAILKACLDGAYTFRALGFQGTGSIVCPPGGRFPKEALALLDYFDLIALSPDFGGTTNLKPWVDSRYIYGNNEDSYTEAQLQALVVKAVVYGCPVCVYWHSTVDADWTKFKAHIDWVADLQKYGLLECIDPLDYLNQPAKLRPRIDMSSETITGTANALAYGRTYLNSSGGAVTGTLPDPTGEQGYTDYRFKYLKMTDATTSSTVSVTHSDQAAGGAHSYTFDAVGEDLLLVWDIDRWVEVYKTCTDTP